MPLVFPQNPFVCHNTCCMCVCFVIFLIDECRSSRKRNQMGLLFVSTSITNNVYNESCPNYLVIKVVYKITVIEFQFWLSLSQTN